MPQHRLLVLLPRTEEWIRRGRIKAIWGQIADAAAAAAAVR
jgi:hypothetical protein